MLSIAIEYIKGHSFIAMLLAFQGSSTCHVPGQRCLAGCSKSNRLNRREFGQKIGFFLLCQNFVDQNRPEFRSYSVHRHRMGFEDDILTFWQPCHSAHRKPCGTRFAVRAGRRISHTWWLRSSDMHLSATQMRISMYLSPFHLFPTCFHCRKLNIHLLKHPQFQKWMA